ncbi:MAG: tetratricopeptide repeat protein, partial [Acidobacteriota bacterium]
RARWVLDNARQLDPDRPETDYAAAAIQKLAGDYLGVVRHTVQGHFRLLQLPLERSIWLHNLVLWLIYTLILAGGLFVALQMATKGGALLYDLARFMSPPLPLTTADILTIIALLWPLLLPSGLLWLGIYWSILLWGYGSWSEKLVFVVLWLSLGFVPLILSAQQRAVQVSLAPPVRAVDNLQAGRLHGAFFSDLGVLRTLLPNHALTRELAADLHRRFGQWEHARSLYTALIEEGGLDGQASAAAHNNLGVYHHRKKDYGTAVNYFRQATLDDPTLPEAFFNLAQGYSQLYKFSDSNSAMADAKKLDRERVNRWERAEVSVEDSAVGIDGGIRRGSAIRQELRAIWYGEEESVTPVDLWRRYFSLSVVAGIMLLAMTLHQVRSQLGYRSNLLESRTLLSPNLDRWVRAAVPGLIAARDERGGRAFLSLLLPAALLTLVLVQGLGYRAPLAIDSGTELSTFVGFGGLVLWLLTRLARELKR